MSATVRGVSMGDVYRDRDGDLWEAIGLVTEPQAVVRRVKDGHQEEHVIGCLNWKNKWTQRLQPDGVPWTAPT